MKTYTIDGVTVTEEQLRKVIQENPELKEKQGRWKPEIDEKYWFVNDYGGIDYNYATDFFSSSFRTQSNNCFKTEEEAKKHLKRIEAISTVTLAIKEANDGWIPDWENFNEDKFYIAYYYYYDWFSHHRFNLVDILSTLPCIKSGKIAQALVYQSLVAEI